MPSINDILEKRTAGNIRKARITRMIIKELISKRKINKRIKAVAKKISHDYAGKELYRELDYVGVVEK